MKPDVVLIDGNNMLHRQYYAFKELESRKDGVVFKTGMLYGVIKNLLLFKEKYPNARFYYCFDSPYNNIRKTIYSEYKANRQKKEEEFIVSYGMTIEALRYLGISIVKVDYYEADDVMYSLMLLERQKSEKTKVLVVSNDHDMYQLLQKNVAMLLSKPKGVYEVVRKKDFLYNKGILPKQYKSVMCLSGCSGDNVSGIQGIGEKNAVKLIKEYKNLKNLGENLDKIKGKIGENLRKDWKIVKRNKKLVKLLEIPSKKINIERKEPDMKSLRYLFKQVGFKQYLLEENWNKLKKIAKGQT